MSVVTKATVTNIKMCKKKWMISCPVAFSKIKKTPHVIQQKIRFSTREKGKREKNNMVLLAVKISGRNTNNLQYADETTLFFVISSINSH